MTPMPSIPYTRKAGDGGACAVLIGGGDGSLLRDVIPVYDRVVVIFLPGESPFPDVPKTVDQYVVRGQQDAHEVVSHGFAHQHRVIELEATDFYSQHPCVADPQVRADFAAMFFSLLALRPFTMGDCIIDGLQGAYHIALSAHHVIGAPTPDELPKLSCPAISIASGPSLAKHLDALRVLQHKCLLICADTALEGLLKAGITPHIVTPLERVTAVAEESFPAAHYPGVIFGGVPVVHQTIAPKFDKHLLVPGSDVVFLWMGAKTEQLFFYGQSTGVLSATVAAQLTTGPVYLVGHDLAFNDKSSHWGEVHAGVQLGDDVIRVGIPGNNGGTVQSQAWWQMFLGELSDLSKLTGRIVNVNGHTGDGAVIPHTISAALPDPDSLEPFSLPQWPEPNAARITRFAALLKQLPGDARGVLDKLCNSKFTLGYIDFRKLCASDNRLMLGYVFRSVIGQFGMQHMNGVSAEETTLDCANAMRNALRQLLPIFEEMASAQICEPEKHADTRVFTRPALQGASA